MVDPGPAGLTVDDLAQGWRELGVEKGMALIVHASLSALGPVEGGAAAVVDSLRTAIGSAGTLVMPAFTPQIADPDPTHVVSADASVRERRDAVATFDSDLPGRMGAVAEALRSLPDSVRSTHPQVSVAAVGAQAEFVVAHQTLGFALADPRRSVASTTLAATSS